MSELKFKFQIGDTVRFQFQSYDINCPVVAIRPTGGGMKGMDPLYVIRHELGFDDLEDIPAGPNGVSQDGKELPVHGCFLTLVQRNVPDVDFDISSLI